MRQLNKGELDRFIPNMHPNPALTAGIPDTSLHAAI
jgi:hypothetical protein